MKELQLGEIGIVNLKLRTEKGKVFNLNDVIFSHPYDKRRTKLSYSSFDDRRLINKTKFKEDLQIIEIEVLKSVGWKSKLKDYTEHKANKPLLRNIDGSYE